jgi:CHAT domain-containing protein
LDEEIRDIQNGLERAKHREKFALLQRWAVRTKDLQRAMLDEKPQIVHFSGHGVTLKKEGDGTITPGSRAFANLDLDEDIKMNLENYSGGIMIENEDGSPKIVSASALGALFELFAGSIQCVLLNACHSKAQAEALIKAGVPYVIGMNTEVPDKTAIVFATRFYDALGAGETIDKAFRHGKAALLLDDLPGADIPELIQPK